MTTTVTIRANAWPVRVTERTATQGEQGHDVQETTTRVPGHTTRDFHVHSGMDLVIHEIQQGEADFEEEGSAAEKAPDEPATETVDQAQEATGETIVDQQEPGADTAAKRKSRFE